MSNGASACSAWVIEKDKLKGFLKKPFQAFMKALDYEKMPFDDFCQAVQYETEDGLPMPIGEAWEALQKAFNKKTHLELGVDYHNSDDEGSCYDDVNGGFFTVAGVVHFTPAGLRARGKITQAFWVQFG